MCICIFGIKLWADTVHSNISMETESRVPKRDWKELSGAEIALYSKMWLRIKHLSWCIYQGWKSQAVMEVRSWNDTKTVLIFSASGELEVKNITLFHLEWVLILSCMDIS